LAVCGGLAGSYASCAMRPVTTVVIVVLLLIIVVSALIKIVQVF
jgi:hypothetical protein